MPVRIAEPMWKVGDRCKLVRDSRTPAEIIGEPEVVVERIDGPYIGREFDKMDSYLYRVYEPTRGIRYPAKGKGLKAK
jgi:hypothetical protein